MLDRKEVADSGKDKVVYEIFTVTNMEKSSSFKYVGVQKKIGAR